ncbi:MAG: DUF502 domain-containing protein [Phycisphaerae bacterium]
MSDSDNNKVENVSAPARKGTVVSHLRSVFISGLITLVPLIVTIWVIELVYHFVTFISYPAAQWIVGSKLFEHLLHAPAHSVEYLAPVIAIILSIAAIYGLGILGSFVLGRQILNAIDRFIENLPLLKGIYSTTKQVIGVFRRGGGGAGFQRVVLAEFPGPGLWTIAFVTNEIQDSTCGTHYVTLFIPMTPNPTSGFFQMARADAVRNTDWTVDQGIKIVLSGGLLAPSMLDFGAKSERQKAAT